MKHSLTPLACCLILLAGCAVGPDYEAPQPQAPASWQAAHSGDTQLHPAQGMCASAKTGGRCSTTRC